MQDEYPDVAFVKVDTTDDAVASLAEEQGVKVLPTFKFFKGGEEVKQPVSGYKKKPLEDAVKHLAKGK